MRAERCPQAVAYLRYCQYTNYRLTILGVKYTQSAEGVWPSRRWCEPNAALKQWLIWGVPIYQRLVDYIGSKVCSVNWGSLTFPSAIWIECCAQAVAYLSYYQYTDHRSIILGVKVPREYVAPVAYEHFPCSVGRMDAASIVSGNVWERFHECWHERFNAYIFVLSIFCRYTNRDSIS